MKQRDLLLAGLLLLGGSVFAQNAPDLTNPNSAKQATMTYFIDNIDIAVIGAGHASKRKRPKWSFSRRDGNTARSAASNLF